MSARPRRTPSSWLSPSTHRKSNPAENTFERADRLRPLRHATDAVGRHVLVRRQPDDVSRRRRVGDREEVEVRTSETSTNIRA